MKDENCIFCKLANGDIPTMTLYEDEEFRVIYDANPRTLGHALVLPKNHFTNIYDIDEETVGKAFIVAKKVAIALTEVFSCDGFNIIQNNNECAGQTIFHLHIHLVPRYKGEPKLKSLIPGKQKTDKLEASLEKIHALLQQTTN